MPSPMQAPGVQRQISGVIKDTQFPCISPLGELMIRRLHNREQDIHLDFEDFVISGAWPFSSQRELLPLCKQLRSIKQSNPQ